MEAWEAAVGLDCAGRVVVQVGQGTVGVGRVEDDCALPCGGDGSRLGVLKIDAGMQLDILSSKGGWVYRESAQLALVVLEQPWKRGEGDDRTRQRGRQWWLMP